MILKILLLYYAGSDYWVTANGLCAYVEKGIEPTKKETQTGLTKDECFKQCEKDPSLSGCSHGGKTFCHKYTGKITGGSGLEKWTCHYRSETGRKFQI